MNYEQILLELINTPKSSNKYLTKLVDYDPSTPCKYKIILAVDKDENNQQCVMLQLKNGGAPADVIINNINTLNSIKISSLPADLSSELDVYYTIKLFQNTGDAIFYSFINDVISTVKTSKADLIILDVLKRVKSWINFFKTKKLGVLSEEKQIGLFAELTLLKSLLVSNTDKLLEIVLSWVGPKAQNQDFIFANKNAIEVKCTTSNNPFEVSINNEYQLDSIGLKRLFLVIYQVKRHKNNLNSSFPTIPSIIFEIKELLANHSEAKFEFENSLIDLGYLDEFEIEYQAYGFQIIIGPVPYEIDSNFPKIIRSVIPNSITKVEYNLNIQSQTSSSEDILKLPSI